MTDFDQFERRLAAAIRSDADMSVGPFKAESIAREAIDGTGSGAMRPSLASSRPGGRFGRGRGMTLLAAAALLLVGGAAVAGSGALRMLLVPAPSPSISLETPADVQAFVFSSFERLGQLPPEAITTLDSHGSKDRIYIDRSGAVRIERYVSADATKPSTSMLLRGTRFGRTLTVGSNTVWVEQEGAIGDDPRTYLRALSGLLEVHEGSDCAMSPSDDSAGTTATGWRYVGIDSVAGRAARHFACGGGDIWLDEETRLVLRVRQPATDDAGNVIPGAFSTTEVTQIEFSDQPAALFSFAPPDGVATMPLDAYESLCRPGQDTVAFLDYPPCSGTASAAEATSTPAPTPSPTPSPMPGAPSSDCAILSTDHGTPGPLVWTPASVKLDWPAPARSEPVGGASTTPMPPTYVDPSGDDGSNGRSCADIREVTADPDHVSFDLMSNPPHDVDPSTTWIAYGVVVDEDRDGVADWRYGIDNLPSTMGKDVHRAWRTNLHTGVTEFDPDPEPNGWGVHGDPLFKIGDAQFGTGYPGASAKGPRFLFSVHGDVAGGGTSVAGAKQDKPFYVWASEIVGGRVVATDYAPDTGWLIPTPDDTNPGGTYVVPGVVGGRLPFRLTVDVPSGWTTNGPMVSPSHTGDETTGLEFLIVDHPAEWGCDASGHAVEPPVGPTVDDLVTFLGRQPMLKISANTDVAVGPYRGKYLEYTTTVNDNNCHAPEWPLDTRQPGNVGFTQEWILDVGGVRLVIDGFAPKASDPVKAEFTRIVESISIGP